MSQIEQRLPSLPAPDRVGQGTAIEQSRAVTQVLAAVEVAQRYPRDVQAAINQMRQSCQQLGLAERAFYRYPRGGQTITGPSVHLARELARIWGHVDYGIVEMRRDDDYGQSEMLAFAWDLQTNARNSNTFISPHKRDTRDGPKPLTDMREIYEANTNQGARRVREAVFAILPPWFVDEAKDLCAKTLQDGGGKPLVQRIADAVGAFEGIGVTADRIEAKVGRPRARWTEHDVAQLGIAFKSIQRGELRVEDEFPPPALTEAEIFAARAPSVDPDAEAAAQAAAERGGE